MMDTGAFVRGLQGRPIAIFGLGLSGLSTAKALRAGGADVKAWDDSEEKRKQAHEAGIEIVPLIDAGLNGYTALILAPGIPLHFPSPHPVVLKAREAGVEVIGDLEILYRCCHGRRTVGITGTNGKSTTTMLTTHILRQAGQDSVAGGNIGKPVLDLDMPRKDGVFVLEMSSYQIDLCPTFRPDISVLLNITPDHLDRHGGLEGYAAAKQAIFEGRGIAVCGVDDSLSAVIYEQLVKDTRRKAIPVSVKKEIAGGVYLKGHELIDNREGRKVPVGSIHDIPALPGLHNSQNLLAAYAVCSSLGIGPEDFLQYARSYPGLPHRQFLTRVINGVAYVNDSKATNAEATSKALSCYSNIYLILGGRPKEGGLSGIEPYLDNIRHVFLIGEAMDDFAQWLSRVGVPHTKSQTLDVALLEGHAMAQAQRGAPGGAGTVLLSPACASWDQFKSFEHRGDVFTQLVNTLSEEVPS